MEEFRLFQKYVFDNMGITLADHKITLVQGRLSKRLRVLNIPSYREYYKYVINDKSGEEEDEIFDLISTHVTEFFREKGQWDYLNENLEHILEKKRDKRIRIWSAACSTGEEPYSLAIFLHGKMPDWAQWDIKILATDLSKVVIRKAARGVYREDDVGGGQKGIKNVPRHILGSYFELLKTESGERAYRIIEEMKRPMTFRTFNLVYGDFKPFVEKFDIIFCRNMMIYLDPEAQRKLVSNYHRALVPGGFLFVGHSESLTQNKDEFKLIKPSIYQKI
jgi:chemotaxis protein methyltransferase CheR